jgi:hypothetical protein
MSHAHDASAHPRTEEDRIDSRTVVLVGVGSLVVFALASLAAGAYLYQRTADRAGPPLPAELGQSKIALVEQRLFDLPQRGAIDRAARLQRLGSYGWVDQGKQVAHLPIEVAMELVAAGVRATPTVPPTAPPLSSQHGGVDAPSVPIAAPAAPPAAPPAKGARR